MTIESAAPASEAEPSLMDSAPAAEAAPAADPKPDDKPAEGEPAADPKPDDKPAEPTADEVAAEEARRAALTDEERAAEDKAKADAEKAAAGAPEEYAEFKAPEGMTLNAESLDALKAFGKDANLSQDQAQAVVDMGAKLVENMVQQMTDAFLETRKGWREASQADAEFGGAKIAENMAVAVRAREQFGTPELKNLLNEYGLGDHPEVIRFFFRTGKAMSEDIFVQPGKPGGDKSPAAKIFDHPTSTPKK